MDADKKRNGLLAAGAALLLQGAWAIYANHLHGWHAGLKAGAVQGASSFCMTFCVTLWIEYLLQFFSNSPPRLRLAETVLLAVLGMLLVQVGVHWIAGTPEILRTVAPAASIGTMYCVVYSLGRIFLGKDSQSTLLHLRESNEKNRRPHQ